MTTPLTLAAAIMDQAENNLLHSRGLTNADLVDLIADMLDCDPEHTITSEAIVKDADETAMQARGENPDGQGAIGVRFQEPRMIEKGEIKDWLD